MESWARRPSQIRNAAPSDGALAVRSNASKGKGRGKGSKQNYSPASSSSTFKRARYDSSRRSEFQAVKHLSATSARLSLQTAAIARLLFAQAVITIFMPSNSITEALEMVSEDPVKPHLLHVQRWGDLMLAIIDEPRVGEDVRTIVQNHVASTPMREQLLPHIQLCQSQPFKEDPGMHLIQLRVSSDFHHIAAQVLKALVSLGGTIQFGTKSRTGLERATQEALDAVRAFQ